MDNELIQEIRERNDIVDVISSYVTLKRSGKNYVALCPFHQEKTPSFTVSPEKQLWHCFGCGAGGDVFAFIQRIENLTFPEAAAKLAERVGLKWRVRGRSPQKESLRLKLLELNRMAMEFYEQVLWSSAGRKAQEYLKRRGVTEEIARQFHIGYAPASWEALARHFKSKGISPQEAHQAGLLARAEADDRYYDRFRDRLMFPILSIQNEVLGFGGRTLGDSPAKYINTPETPIFRKRHNLYALNLAAPAIREQDHAIVVEGYMDVISLHQYGFHNSVATMGTALTPQVLSLLRRYTRTLFLAFDADSAGMNAILRSSALFRQQEVVVRVVKIPQGMDPDECVRRRGAEAFKELLHDSLSVLDYKVEQFLNSEVGSHPTSRALREAMQILAEADDPLQREEVMQRMALRWTGGDGERVIPLMEALRQTWRRWQRRAMNVAVNADNAEHTDPIAQTLMQRSQSEIPLGVERAERELIAAMMQDEVVARTVLEQMTPNEFLLPLHQQLAQMVAACLDADEFDKLPEYVSEAPDEQLKAKASGLLVADLNFLSAKNALETRIQTIRRYKLKKQLRARRNELLKMASNGRIDPRAPEVQELLELERKLRGKVTATTSS